MGVFQHWPNRITAIRFLGACVVFAVLTFEESSVLDRRWTQLGFWLFVLTAASDVVDGWLARRGGHETAFGRIADPFVDKVLVLGAMVFLSALDWSRHYLPAWIVVVVMAREFLITGLRGYVESQGGKLAADWFGKVKMFAQCFAVGTILGMRAFDLESAPWPVVARVFVWLTLLTSIGSCLQYLVKTRRFLLESAQ
jgi:CDP-diacylglycerol--glycerol-3-phosphate 3-phosphatidyltransferase